jgi:hypothetical protein
MNTSMLHATTDSAVTIDHGTRANDELATLRRL